MDPPHVLKCLEICLGPWQYFQKYIYIYIIVTIVSLKNVCFHHLILSQATFHTLYLPKLTSALLIVDQ